MSENARVTLRDIAAKLGVSHVTVSLALKNHPRISAQRREEVRRLADEMGYAPDPMLSSLIVYRQSKRPAEIHSALAWVNHWENPAGLRKVREFDGYWQGAAEAAQRFGYRLDEFVWEPKMSAKRFETILLTRNVRGILVPPHERQPDWGDFDWSRFSTVRFGLSSKTPDSHIVTSDQMRGVMIAMEKIHSYGYKRIGFVMNAALDRKVGGNYIAGYYAAERQLALSPALPPLSLPEDYAESRGLVREWLARHKPDAILTNSGSVPRILEDLRVRVPEDVALAGTTVYDLPISAGLNQHPEEIGRVAVELLVSMINVYDRGTPRVPRRVLIDSEWVDGPSLPPKAGEKPEQRIKGASRAKAH